MAYTDPIPGWHLEVGMVTDPQEATSVFQCSGCGSLIQVNYMRGETTEQAAMRMGVMRCL